MVAGIVTLIAVGLFIWFAAYEIHAEKKAREKRFLARKKLGESLPPKTVVPPPKTQKTAKNRRRRRGKRP